MRELHTRSVAGLLLLTLSYSWLAPSGLAASVVSHARYMGGTSAAVAQRSVGTIDTTDEERFRFQTKASTLEVAYRWVNLLEYGQKVERRYILAILISPLFLLAKSRQHFLTVGYADPQGRQQALVFQVYKGDIRAVLANLEARTGLKIQYQDEEARLAGRD